MIAIDNSNLVGLGNNCGCNGFSPAVAYTYNSGAKTVSLTDGSSFGAGDALKTVNVMVFDDFGNKALGSIQKGGSGYTSAPTIAFSGGGGSGAAATAVVTNGSVTGITITNAGSGYTSAPTIAFSGGGGSGAVATAVLSGATVGSTIITGTTGAIDVAALDATHGLNIKATVSSTGGCVSDGSLRNIGASGSLSNWDRDFTGSEAANIAAPDTISV